VLLEQEEWLIEDYSPLIKWMNWVSKEETARMVVPYFSSFMRGVRRPDLWLNREKQLRTLALNIKSDCGWASFFFNIES